MTENIEGIVLSRVRYSDKGQILSVYTRSYGRLAFAVMASGGKRGSGRHACMMPLACVNIRMRYDRTREVQRLSGLELSCVHSGIYSDMRKQAICMFMSEFLGRLLRQQPADEPLWQYLRMSVQYLNLAAEGVENFHIAMLAGLTCFMGIQPDMSGYAPGRIFDMQEGVFRSSAPLHRQWLGAEEAGTVRLLSRLSYANMHCLRINRQQRALLIEGLLRYYDLHFPGTGTIKSLEVLRSL